MRPTVVLFDVDGTLVTTGGAGRRALERAFERRHGRRDACAHFAFDGMTDRAIIRGGLLALGLPTEEAAIDEMIAVYLEGLAEEVAAAAVYRLHNGIERAVEASAAAGFAVGLGTGNVREGARIKLERVRFNEPFAFGGFGCDHEDRAELLRRGAERGAEQLGAPLAECRVVIVGDTPKDVAAARAIGAQSVAVGTGSYGPAQLLACGATFAFRDLDEAGAVDALVGSNPPA